MKKQRRFKRLLIMLIAIVVIGLVGVIGCTESPFIPAFIPPADKYYIEATPDQIDEGMLSPYSDPYFTVKEYAGKNFIIKNIKVDEAALSTRQEGHIYFFNISHKFLHISKF